MVLHRVTYLSQCMSILKRHCTEINLFRCSTITTRSGAVLPKPKRTRFGFFGVVCGVGVGVFLGATISKIMANFLEENELFVPVDDDDDDD